MDQNIEPGPGLPSDPDTPEDGELPVATGEPRVDAAVEGLDALGSQPVSEHPAVFERIHGRLVEVLGELRADPDPATDTRRASD